MAGRITHYKIVLLGDTAVGKSCLVVRFVRNEFSETEQVRHFLWTLFLFRSPF